MPVFAPQVGRMLQSTLVEGNRQKCGYAAVADLATGQQEMLHPLVCQLVSIHLSGQCQPSVLLHVLSDTTCLSLWCLNMVCSICKLA